MPKVIPPPNGTATSALQTIRAFHSDLETRGYKAQDIEFLRHMTEREALVFMHAALRLFQPFQDTSL